MPTSTLSANKNSTFLWSANNANQPSLEGPTLTKTGTVNQIAGVTNEAHAVRFSGNIANYLKDAAATQARWAGSYSVRVRADAIAHGASNMGMVGAGDQWLAGAGGFHAGWYFFFNGTNIQWTVNLDGNTTSTGVTGGQTSATNFPTGPHQFILRHDLADRRLTLFVDGRRYRGSQYGAGHFPDTPVNNLNVGYVPRGDTPPGNLPLTADLGPLEVWTDAKTDIDVLALFNGYMPGGLAIADYDSLYPSASGDIPGVESFRSCIGNLPDKVFAEGSVAWANGRCSRMKFQCAVPGVEMVIEWSNGIYAFAGVNGYTGEDGAANPGTHTIKASMYCPDTGQVIPLTFNGGSPTVTLNYGDVVECDPIDRSVHVFFEDEIFYVITQVVSYTGSLPAHHQFSAAAGEGWATDTADHTSDTSAANFSGGNGLYGYAPTGAYMRCAVLNATDERWENYCLITDSIGEGLKHPRIAAKNTKARGVNIGSAGDAIAHWKARPGAAACRLKIAAKYSCVWNQDCINSVQADESVATMQGEHYWLVNTLYAATGRLRKYGVNYPTPYSKRVAGGPGDPTDNTSESRTVLRNGICTWLDTTTIGADFAAACGMAVQAYRGSTMTADAGGRQGSGPRLNLCIITGGNATVETDPVGHSGIYTDKTHTVEYLEPQLPPSGTPHYIHPDTGTYQTQIAADEQSSATAFFQQARTSGSVSVGVTVMPVNSFRQFNAETRLFQWDAGPGGTASYRLKVNGVVHSSGITALERGLVVTPGDTVEVEALDSGGSVVATYPAQAVRGDLPMAR